MAKASGSRLHLSSLCASLQGSPLGVATGTDVATGMDVALGGALSGMQARTCGSFLLSGCVCRAGIVMSSAWPETSSPGGWVGRDVDTPLRRSRTGRSGSDWAGLPGPVWVRPEPE